MQLLVAGLGFSLLRLICCEHLRVDINYTSRENHQLGFRLLLSLLDRDRNFAFELAHSLASERRRPLSLTVFNIRVLHQGGFLTLLPLVVVQVKIPVDPRSWLLLGVIHYLVA